MALNFIIKKGKEPIVFYFSILYLFLVLVLSLKIEQYWALTPIIFLLSMSILADLIMLIRWGSSFAVFLDLEKKEIILNHTLFFYKKKISIKDIKEVDDLNGNIVLSNSAPLSKCQRMLCKMKESDDYIIRFEAIDNYEKKQLIELLLSLK